MSRQEFVEGLERYPEDENAPVNQVAITKIVVPTERDKEQLLLALRYIHDLRDIDTDYYAVNTIAHQHMVPESKNIVVESNPDELKDLVKQFFKYLDVEEESDSGTRFRPTYITSCRTMTMVALSPILVRMKELANG